MQTQERVIHMRFTKYPLDQKPTPSTAPVPSDVERKTQSPRTVPRILFTIFIFFSVVLPIQELDLGKRTHVTLDRLDYSPPDAEVFEAEGMKKGDSAVATTMSYHFASGSACEEMREGENTDAQTWGLVSGRTLCAGRLCVEMVTLYV